MQKKNSHSYRRIFSHVIFNGYYEVHGKKKNLQFDTETFIYNDVMLRRILNESFSRDWNFNGKLKMRRSFAFGIFFS